MSIGSNFDDFLANEGCLEEVEAEAFKRVLAWKIQQSMDENGINKSQMAKKMHTIPKVIVNAARRQRSESP